MQVFYLWNRLNAGFNDVHFKLSLEKDLKEESLAHAAYYRKLTEIRVSIA
jgi:hypothetical protein